MKTQSTTLSRKRMSSDERRAAIIEAVMPVFAEKGFAGTTTKELAEAAGVSEALLYRHFPSKESLYEQIQNKICDTDSSIHDFVHSLKPGSESIVKLVYLIFRIVADSQRSHPHGTSVCRMMIQSLLEDGDFARSFNEPRFNQMLPHMEECAKASIAEGEMVQSPLSHNERQWFSHHLAVCLRLSHLADNSVFAYDAKPGDLLMHGVWFSLRGLGMKEEVIERFLEPERLDPEIDDVLFRAGLLETLDTE